MIEQFHFLRAHMLWLLIPNLIFMIFGILSIRQDVRWKKIIAKHLRPFMIKKGSEAIKVRMQILLSLFLSLAILGLAGPTWEKIKIPGKLLQTPVVIALDLSQSMMVEDISPNRLERAKLKITDFLDAGPRSRVALVAFAGTAHRVVPLSSDYEIIKAQMNALDSKTLPYQGTDLKAALDLSDSIMSSSSAPGILVLFSDAIDTSNSNAIESLITSSKIDLEIVPMATPFGGRVPGVQYKSEPVYSVLDTLAVKRFNAMEGIRINLLSLDDSDMIALAKRVADKAQFQDSDKELEDNWKDEGLYFILPFLIFVLFWFRKGVVIYGLLIVVSLSSCKDSDLWYTRDYQGQMAFDQKDYARAADLYQQDLYRGVAYFKAGDYENAILAFSKDTTAMGAYNLGLAYFRNGDLQSAELAFGRASEMDPELQHALEGAAQVKQQLRGEVEISKKEAEEAKQNDPNDSVRGRENNTSEDLGGGGQEATKEQMQQDRLEETVSTNMRKGKELDELPDDMDFSKGDNNSPILMQVIPDDPGIFLRKKFLYQTKKQKIKPRKTDKKW